MSVMVKHIRKRITPATGKLREIFGLTVLMAVISLSGCGAHHDQRTIRMGFVPGPYRQEFEAGVAPQLEKEGYHIQYKEFADGIVCNSALATGEIDANIMQHRTYLAATNAQNGTHLTAVVEVPTPPMGLFSTRHSASETPPQNAEVVVPDTAVNILRAFRILRGLGWIKYNDTVSADTISPRDVTYNPYHLRFVELDAGQGPRSLQDVDYAAIQGNFVISAGLKLDSAIALEKRDPGFLNVVVVNQPNVDKPFVKAIVKAYHAPFFKQAIDRNPDFNGYMPPDYFLSNEPAGSSNP